MKHLIVPLTLVIALVVTSTVRGQEGFNPQFPPPPPMETVPPPTPPPPMETVPPPTPPPSAPPSVYAQPAQPVPPPATPDVPPAAPDVPPPAMPDVPPPGPPAVAPAAPAVPPPPPEPWIISAEALALERTVGSSIPLGFTSGATTDHLLSDSAQFPMAGGFRLQISSSEWKDNKTTISDFIYWGQQQGWVGRTIYGDPLGDATLAHSPWLLQISTLDGGMNDSLGYAYRSRIDNVESNDRIRLTPYDPDWNVNWLGGIRYLRWCDDFTLDGSNLAPSNSESRAIQAKNSLIGMQSGLQMLWGRDRLQLSTEAKVGLYANFYAEHATDSGSGSPAIVPSDGRKTAATWPWSSRPPHCSATAWSASFGCGPAISITASPDWHWRHGNSRAGVTAASWASTARRWAWNWTGDGGGGSDRPRTVNGYVDQLNRGW